MKPGNKAFDALKAAGSIQGLEIIARWNSYLGNYDRPMFHSNDDIKLTLVCILQSFSMSIKVNISIDKSPHFDGH